MGSYYCDIYVRLCFDEDVDQGQSIRNYQSFVNSNLGTLVNSTSAHYAIKNCPHVVRFPAVLWILDRQVFALC